MAQTLKTSEVYPPLSKERRYLVGMRCIGAAANFNFSNDEDGFIKQQNVEQWAEFVKPEDVLSLLREREILSARVSELQGELGEAKTRHAVEVLDILRDMRLPLLPFAKTGAAADTEAAIALGRNMERQAINAYCNQKAYEYDSGGIGPDPTEVGQWDTRPAAPLPVLGEEAGPVEEEAVCECAVAIWQTDVDGKQRCSRCGLLVD